MISIELLEKVNSQVRQHCRQAKGYEKGPWVNPLVPSDCVSAFAMARALTQPGNFDHYVAVAPEGHVYGFFFQQLGFTVLSVHVDYPPRRCQVLDDLTILRDDRVLILEDDVVSGITLRLVVDAVMGFGPRLLALYLGRPKESQQLEKVPPEIERVFVAEDQLHAMQREQYESEFADHFAG